MPRGKVCCLARRYSLGKSPVALMSTAGRRSLYQSFPCRIAVYPVATFASRGCCPGVKPEGLVRWHKFLFGQLKDGVRRLQRLDHGGGSRDCNRGATPIALGDGLELRRLYDLLWNNADSPVQAAGGRAYDLMSSSALRISHFHSRLFRSQRGCARSIARIRVFNAGGEDTDVLQPVKQRRVPIRRI